jgi:o-succinylbenzoate---CoA ligase
MHNYIINDKAYLEHELRQKASESMVSAPEWEKNHWQVILEWLDNPNAITAQTSGSTGTPKKIQHSGRAVRASAMITSEFFDLREGSLALLCLPSTFIGGKMMILRALIHGWQLDWCEPSSNPFVAVKKHYDFTAITPHQCTVALQSGYSFKLFKHVLLGGAALNNALRNQLLQLPAKFYLGYAMTETLTHIAMHKVDASMELQTFHCLGKCSVALDARGCLRIHAPHLDQTDIVTNDLAELIDSKTFKLLGRLDDVINSGGIKIHPLQIENTIENFISKPFYISKIADDVLGEKVILKIEDSPWNADQLDELESKLVDNLPPFHRPKEIHFEVSFRYTENQKIIRR